MRRGQAGVAAPTAASVPARRVWRPRVVLAAVVATALLSACQPTPTPLITQYNTTTAAILTRDGSDRYDFRSTTNGPLHGMTITGRKTNTSTNLRMVGFKKASPSSVDQVSCVTLRSGNTGIAQPGVALRIAASPDRVRAITVTQSIIYGARWVFHVHLGDSKDNSMTRVGSLTIDWVRTPLPWVICGRAEGRTITMKLWPLAEAEPSWHDPAHSAAVTVPRAWVYAGRPGFYAGHLAAGNTLDYSNLSASAVTAQAHAQADLAPAQPDAPQERAFH